MNVFTTITQLLDQQNIPYQLLEHQPVYTMEQAAAVCNHSPDQGVKTLLIKLYTSKRQFEYWLVIWQGNKQIPLAKICTDLEYKKGKLARPEDVVTELGIEVGALAPFGYDSSYPVIFDTRLLNQNQVYINPGVHDKTIALAPADLLPIIEQTSKQFIRL